MPGIIRKFGREFTFPEIEKFINQKEYRNSTWGLFEIRRTTTNQYVENSFVYRHGRPVSDLRDPQFWDNLDDWYTALVQSQIDTEDDIKLKFSFTGGMVILVHEPLLLQEEDYGIVYA